MSAPVPASTEWGSGRPVPTTELRDPAEPLKALRQPFPPEQIGKLPRISCPSCRNATSKVCSDHQKSRCDECKQYITGSHFHLDYAGHAAVTARLLAVDPLWSWAPAAFDDSGAPLVQWFDGRAVLWIRLTVCGVSRLGVGIVEGSVEIEKQLISDAIRNAAMRFGVALDLWSKEDLQGHDGAASGPVGGQVGGGRESEDPSVAPGSLPPPDRASAEQLNAIEEFLHDASAEQRKTFGEWWKANELNRLDTESDLITAAQAVEAIEKTKELYEVEAGSASPADEPEGGSAPDGTGEAGRGDGRETTEGPPPAPPEPESANTAGDGGEGGASGDPVPSPSDLAAEIEATPGVGPVTALRMAQQFASGLGEAEPGSLDECGPKTLASLSGALRAKRETET